MDLEQQQERQLTGEYEIYRATLDARRYGRVDGGFDKSWTQWVQDCETAGIGDA